MRDKGWKIACVRIPTHGPMRAIEDEAFDPALFEAMGDRLGVPFVDYGVVEGETSDGSHLGVGGARRLLAAVGRGTPASSRLAALNRSDVGRFGKKFGFDRNLRVRRTVLA